MTITTTARRVAYTGDGSTTAFAVTFPFFGTGASAELEVIERVIATGAETVKTVTTDYTVTGGSGSTGTVTAVTAPPATVQWIIRGNTTNTQETDYTANDPFPADTHETALDRRTVVSQEIVETLGRALTFPKTDSSALDPELPSSVDRANNFLGFDSDGNPIASAGSADTVTVSDFMATVLDDTTAAAARSTLGVNSASDTAEGLVELATAAEVATGTDTARAVTPKAAADELIAQGKQTIWVPAAAMTPTVSNGCASLAKVETTAGRPDMVVLDFDASADEHAQFQIAMPKSWDEGTITFQVFWTTTNAGTEGVAWGLQGVSVTDGDTIDVAYGTAVVVTDNNATAAERLRVTSESAAVTIAGTPAAGDGTFFRIFRDVSDAADDMTEDARLIGVKIFYTIDARNDA